MSKENLERFMTRVADSEDLQAKIGEEITGDALVALGAAHGCEFSIEDVQAGAELSDAELEGVSGGVGGPKKLRITKNNKLIHQISIHGEDDWYGDMQEVAVPRADTILSA